MNALADIPLEDLLAEVRTRRAALLAKLSQIDESLGNRLEVDVTRAMEAAAQVWGIAVNLLAKAGRSKAVADARQAAMMWLRQQGWTLIEIGVAFGGRDHCTVRHAVKAVKDKLTVDEDFLAKWLAFRSLLEAPGETLQPEQP
jgi:chromosomal replication initiation ATPase DnaA